MKPTGTSSKGSGGFRCHFTHPTATAAEAGQKEKALEALKKAESEFQNMGMDYWLRKTQEVLARVEK